MILPAAFPLALWGTHFLRGNLSSDQLIDHCGTFAPALLARYRPTCVQIDLAICVPGDFAGILTSHREEIVAAGSIAILDGRLLLPPDFNEVSGTATVTPSRREAEALLIDALTHAHEHFTSSPIFGADAPSVPVIEFPEAHPAKLRELILRSLTTIAIADALTRGWHTDRQSHADARPVVSSMYFAARRGLEAGVRI